ncbi:MAG: hydantoinase/oxoprolinase family protein [Deltaproteobacteria bacterium]|nr:hydantoinase/oxoprolinase family protein [Deltaproteobacteria bacterium]
MSESRTSYRVGIDVGGTFTDVTVLEEGTGQIREVRKVPSNPAAPLDVLDGVLADLRARWGADSLSYLLHGSTHALNTVLEEKGARTGLLTTRGFRDVYEIARQWKGHEVFNIFYPGATRFVPRRRVAEVSERLDKSGEVMVPLDLEAVDEAMPGLMEQGIDALAIAFLFSYVNPAHERLAAEHIRSRYPDLFVSQSSEVNPVWREYERTATTVLNAYLGPRMEQYFAGMEETVLGHFPGAHAFLMKSNGGIGAPRAMARFPVQTLMSGPVAGVVAANELGARTGAANLISLDIGGTSSDMSLIPGKPLFRTEWQIGRHPVRVDSVEVESLGAGGGSLAQVRYGRGLQVGPQSAGAVPGPACYMRGGDQPTLTDALVHLRHLNPRALLQGEMPIDAKLSAEVIRRGVAEPLGMSEDEAALGILRVLVANIVSSMRTITIERGFNPADFVLAPFGGMGPTLATAVASSLGIGRILIPEDPGNFSAFGMLLSDLRSDAVTTRVVALTPDSLQDAVASLRDLEDAVRRELASQGPSEDQIRVDWLLDMRYREQAYELTVPIAKDPAKLNIDEICERFGQAHEQRYGHRADDEVVEVVNLRASAYASLGKPELSRGPDAGTRQPTPERRRAVMFDGEHDVPVFRRDDLAPGAALSGPVIVEEKTSTTVVEPGWELRVDGEGNLDLTNVPRPR